MKTKKAFEISTDAYDQEFDLGHSSEMSLTISHQRPRQGKAVIKMIHISGKVLIQVSLFLDAFSHLDKRVCLSVHPSVRPSVRQTRVEFLRNGPNSNKIASGIRKYVI